VYSTYATSVIASLVLFGRLSDAVGRRRVLLPAVALAALSCALFASASSVAWLFAAQVVEGLALGALQGTALPALVETEPRRDRERAALVGSAATVSGAAFGPAIAGILAQYGWAPRRLAYAVAIALLAAGFVLLLRWFPADRGRGHWRLQRPRVPEHLRAPFAVVGASAFLAWGFASLFLSLVPSYMIELLHDGNLAVIGGVAALMLGCSALVQLAVPGLEARRAQRLGMALVVMAAAALLVAAELHSLAAIVGAGALAGSGLGFTFRGALADVTAIAPEHEKGNMVAAFYIVVYLGTALPVIGVGLVAQATGLLGAVRGFDYVIGVACAIQIVLLSRRVPEARAELAGCSQ
jgi:MFS family permease